MTRKEKIAEAARKYATHPTDTDVTDFHGKWVKETKYNHDEYLAFLEGSQWADENPKSPWISVKDDLPCNHEELLNKDIRGFTKGVLTVCRQLMDRNIRSFGINHMSKYNNDRYHWVTSSFELVTHWMPIPELPKE